jgi:prepilin-type N-terminal cleavage/methylation domain-containing protein
MKRESGFTLIEISIVLVIIGLLLGGVLKGQELIENAKIKRMNNDFSGIASATYSYLDRYSAIPGDDINAAARWPAVGAVPAAISPTASTGALDTPTKTANFWDHLRRSNLIVGGSGTDLPVHAFGGVISVADGYLQITGPVICMDNINGKRAEIIDRQLDDGKPDGGTLRAVASTVALSKTATLATSYSENTTYSLCKQM